MPDLLIATHNQGKVQEYREMLGDALGAFRIIGLQDVGLGAVDVEENGDSFHANAVLKAVTYARASGRITLSDDSGLCVDALDGAPGIYSARYGGYSTEAERRTYLLEQMAHVPTGQRGAQFVCVIALHHPANGRTVTIEGIVKGQILTYASNGGKGFGYDPLFVPEGYDVTFADMPTEEKNRLSHRGRAVVHLPQALEQLMTE